MRSLLLAAIVLGAAATSVNAVEMPDLPFLRGGFTDGLSTARVDWQGFYVGVQGGYGASDENFNGSTSTMMAALLANDLAGQAMGVSQWNLGLGKNSARTSGFGAFGGYNSQWDDVVVGLEASYLHGTFGGSASATQSQASTTALADNRFYEVSATSQSAISITDLATLRARAGYAYGSFLPYLFGGVALGNADITRSVYVQEAVSTTQGGNFTGLQPYSSDNVQHNHLIYGYSFGLGVDVMLKAGLFLRAEWEYLRFASAVDTSINTARLGLGYKF